jgi:ribonuclease P protein component
MTDQALTAEARIRRRPEFERVYNEGARIHGRFMTVFVMPNGGSAARLGVAATRKLGSAVERNRAKRLAREVFRRHKVAAGLDIVVVPRREMLDAPFASLEADYESALERHPRERARGVAGSRRPRRESRSRSAPRV